MAKEQTSEIGKRLDAGESGLLRNKDMKEENTIYGILGVLQTIQDAVKQMLSAYTSGNMREFDFLGTDISEGLTAVQGVAAQENGDDACSRLSKACICATESLKGIRQLVQRKPREAAWKLECELLMILENTALEFYYWELVCGHPERMEEFRQQIMRTGYFYRLEQPVEEREYACDLTLWVTAYNHLDVTKQCIQHLLQNLPKDIAYELILYNHGSDDGTREFFESIEGAHVINVAINRAFNPVACLAAKGKYFLSISNDVLVGENAIDNMFRAIKNHSDYGWIVPSTSNVSNFQTIPVNYDSQEGFLAFAHRNNIYDEKRHEMRTRLCNPIHMIQTDVFNQIRVDMYDKLYGIRNTSSFPDDKIALWMRRNGYKNILEKDAYCHHIGSVTLKNDFDSQRKWDEFYDAGRKKFREDFGVDPWGTGTVYSPELFDAWHLPRMEKATVLGINCGLGSNSLKVRETLKELGAKTSMLYNATQEECWLQDLKGISDVAFVFDEIRDVVVKAGRAKFDFIVIEDQLKDCESKDYVTELDKAGIQYREIAFLDEEGNWHIVRGDY